MQGADLPGRDLIVGISGLLQSMGSDDCSDADLDRLGMDENSVRGFWRGYREFMAL